MKLDIIVEAICLALGDEHFEDTLINSITLHPPTENSQSLTVEDTDKNKFKIEIIKL